MLSFETLKPQMEVAYFESFSGVSPILDTPLPNEPDWESFQPDYATYPLSLGLGIIKNNFEELMRQGIEINHDHVPQMVADMLRLSPEETAVFLGINSEGEIIEPENLVEAFLVARYLRDTFSKKFDDPDLIAGFIRERSWIYADRSMIEMVGEGDGALLVGLTYRSFDVGATA